MVTALKSFKQTLNLNEISFIDLSLDVRHMMSRLILLRVTLNSISVSS